MKYRRFIPLIAPLLIWLFDQAFLFAPVFFYSSLALGALVIVISVKLIASRGEKKYWPLFVVLPLLFFLSFSTYVTIIVSSFWIQLIFLLIAWFLYAYLKYLYYLVGNQSALENSGELENKIDSLLNVGGFLTSYALAAVLFGLTAFLNWSPELMLPAFALIIWLLFLQFLPFKRISWRRTGGLLIINVLALTELAWIFSLFPLNFNILALFSALTYYLSLTIIHAYWRGNLNRQTLKTPLILSAIIIIFSLLIARWL
jgi:hypothetical protein